MITKIIACADIHIRNLRRQDEYEVQLRKFINECKDIVKENGAENTRIVIAGDLLHNKLDISGEGYTFATWFLRQLDKICKTILIAGNHDINMNNLSRLDPLTAIFSMHNFKQVYFLDKELEYESGCMIDDDVCWCLFSSFDSFSKPNIDEVKMQNEGIKYIGLYHGEVKSAKTDSGYISENGLNASYFEGLDFTIMGHIHRPQTIDYKGNKLVYCGSLIQQDHGENFDNHGYIVVDTEEMEYEFKQIENKDYGFFTIEINDFTDFEENAERLINE